MISDVGYVPASAVRPTDPDLAFPIFRNGKLAQLLAGAELKATQGGHQSAFSDTGFGGGALARLPDLPRFLGGEGDDEDENYRRPSAGCAGAPPRRRRIGRARPAGAGAHPGLAPPPRGLHAGTGGAGRRGPRPSKP
jgi:hypothetical protein